MPVVERTITVDQPPEAVWQFLADFTTTEEWDPPTVSTERTSGDGGLGTTYHSVAKFAGQRTEVDYVVTTAGSFDLLAEVVCEDDDQLLELLTKRVRTLPGVASTETFVYLKLNKQHYNWGTR